MIRQQVILATALLAWPTMSMAQYAWQDGADAGKLDLGHNIEYKAEVQASVSSDKTPLWLNANKYGLSSLEKQNGYLHGALERPLRTDSARRWGVGYGVDMAVTYNYTSTLVLQQAFVEARWLHGVLTVGAKQYPMEMKNQTLSSGSQTLGINARPIPQVRLALPEYWIVPGFNRWLQFKGHIAYGRYTDGSWQEEFADKKASYNGETLWHSKAGYLRIGNEDRFCPWSFEMGLEMVAQFGGKCYTPQADGTVSVEQAGSGVKDFLNVLVPGGQDASDGEYGNVEGNHMGSWLLRLNYNGEMYGFHLYGDHFFEDHSQMLFVDYNGYGTGEEYMKKKDRKFYIYKLKDMLVGAEVNIKYGTWLRNIVLEYIYTKYQSGPFNHDHTMNIPDHMAGVDDYYNHGFYHSFQHWGQVIGNPLYRSPIYNSDGTLYVKDNRFQAVHLGFDGQPTENLDYRVLATWQEGLGRYSDPFLRMHHNVSIMVEAAYRFKHNWKVKGAYGMDFGSKQMLGHNAGFQLTVSKTGVFDL